MYSLPLEILERITSHLDFADLENLNNIPFVRKVSVSEYLKLSQTDAPRAILDPERVSKELVWNIIENQDWNNLERNLHQNFDWSNN
jgi:hypothetical protein